MLSENDAYAISYEQINKSDLYWPDKPEIVIIKTDETDHSWIFYCQYRLYIETEEISHVPVGNGPCVVLKSDGRFTFSATFPPIYERVIEAERWLLSGGNSGGRSAVAASS